MEQLGIATDPALESLLHELAKSNSFTMEELAENRAGRMSRRQRRHLTRGLFKLSLLSALYGGVGLAILVSGIVSTSDRDRVWNVLFGLFSLALCRRPILCCACLLRDTWKASAARVEGPGVAFSNGSESLPRSYYLIGGKRFPVHKDAWQALARGVYYAAYYASNSKTLLTIEPLWRRQRKQEVGL